VAEAPAVIVWVVGLADKVNSELLPPLPVVDPTERRGEITQPFATINRLASNNANLRIGESLFPAGPNNNEKSYIWILIRGPDVCREGVNNW
jgi:hypothetical protein